MGGLAATALVVACLVARYSCGSESRRHERISRLSHRVGLPRQALGLIGAGITYETVPQRAGNSDFNAVRSLFYQVADVDTPGGAPYGARLVAVDCNLCGDVL